MTTAEQRLSALDLANEKRMRMVELRRRARAGRHEFAALVLDPPDELLGMMLIDVVRLSRTSQSQKAMERLGRLAVRDGVNLMIPLGRASSRTREWVVEHASWHIYGARLHVLVRDGS